MGIVLNKKTFAIVRSADTIAFKEQDWIRYPDEDVIDKVPKKYWKIDGNILREMTQVEKDELEYNTNSSVYTISTGLLITKKDGREFEGNSDVIINPIIPEGGVEYGKVVDGILVSMTTEEKITYNYANKTQIYLIIEKELLHSQDGNAFEGNANAIIAPIMPNMVEVRFTEVVDSVIVEMNTVDIDAIKANDATIAETNRVSEIAKQTTTTRNNAIADDIAKQYTIADEISMLRKLAIGESLTTDADVVEWLDVVSTAKITHPKV